MTTKRDIQYGPVDLLDKDAFDPKNVKVRITTFVDEDVLILLKEYAKKRGAKYQTVLNALLRSFFDKPEKGKKVQVLSEERVRRIVQEELKKRA
jgi:phosphopantothenoylcysteine synthetase/decarboxylase